MLYVIGDVHLSLSSEKPMDIFGGNWDGYIAKLRSGLGVLRDGDICVFCGDTSWGMKLADALEDFRFLDSFPGKKILLKGNHDYWWETSGKMQKFFTANGFSTLNILHNNFHDAGGIAICGTRGWFFEEDKNTEHDRKIFLRELSRLETSLSAAGDRDKYVFLHYPPIYKDYSCSEITALLAKYGVKHCYYGHIHGAGHRSAFEGELNGVRYTMVSADWLNFQPFLIK